jgi:hypothetical protein
MRSAATALLVIALGGCTTLKVDEPTTDWRSRQGIAYHLPFTQFDTRVVWAASCDNGALSIAADFEATPVTAPDPEGLYVIDYASLDAFTKTSGVNVEFYQSGAIKSINAHADDRTAEILSATIAAAGKLALTAVGRADARSLSPVCSEALIKALNSVGDGEKTVAVLAGRLDQRVRELEGVSARVVREGAALSDATREAHTKAINEVIAAQIELDSAEAALAESMKKVTHVARLAFPDVSSREFAEDGLQIPAGTLSRWLNDASQGQVDQLAERTAIWLEIAPKAQFGTLSAAQEAASDATAGIRYRVGVPGELRACRAALCGRQGELVQAMPVTLLNRGTTFYLPFHSAAFTNASLTATFSEGGVLTSAGYDQKRAPGEALAGVLGTAAGEIAGIVEAGRANDKTELELAEEQLKLVKAQDDLATALAAREETTPDPGVQQAAAFAADTTLKAAEVANINAEIALIEARGRLAEAGRN